jgi:hypothetical protein
VQHGHGPLQNILDNYTFKMANNFLREIGKAELEQRITDIYNYRVAQATEDRFKETIGRFRRAQRVAQAKEQQETRQGAAPMTEKEIEALQGQQHVKLSALPVEQRTQFETERDAMWSQIPAHLQEKARKLAGH